MPGEKPDGTERKWNSQKQHSKDRYIPRHMRRSAGEPLYEIRLNASPPASVVPCALQHAMLLRRHGIVANAGAR